MPDALRLGLPSLLLFFDRIIVPDRDYVQRAFYELARPFYMVQRGMKLQPKSHLEWDITYGPMRGHLLIGKNLIDRFLATWNTLRSVCILVEPEQKTGVSIKMRPFYRSFDALDALNMMNETRIRAAMQIAHQGLVDVCTVKSHLNQVDFTAMPSSVDKSLVLQYF